MARALADEIVRHCETDESQLPHLAERCVQCVSLRLLHDKVLPELDTRSLERALQHCAWRHMSHPDEQHRASFINLVRFNHKCAPVAFSALLLLRRAETSHATAAVSLDRRALVLKCRIERVLMAYVRKTYPLREDDACLVSYAARCLRHVDSRLLQHFVSDPHHLYQHVTQLFTAILRRMMWEALLASDDDEGLTWLNAARGGAIYEDDEAMRAVTEPIAFTHVFASC